MYVIKISPLKYVKSEIEVIHTSKTAASIHNWTIIVGFGSYCDSNFGLVQSITKL